MTMMTALTAAADLVPPAVMALAVLMSRRKAAMALLGQAQTMSLPPPKAEPPQTMMVP